MKKMDEFETATVRESVLRALSMMHQMRFSAASSYLSVAAAVLGILPDDIEEETKRGT